MTVEGRDSAQPPTPDQVAAAAAAGVKVWGGYLASGPGMGLLRPWTASEFEVVKALPGRPVAFCSGWDDPAWCAQTAQQWGVLCCLDVEGGIRGDGPWVQPWLDASGGGLYGGAGIHAGRLAAFHILAYYPTDGNPSGASWWVQLPRPNDPCAWQCLGTHLEFGLEVDSWRADDWFGGAFMALTDAQQQAIVDDVQYLRNWVDQNGDPLLRDVQAAVSKGAGVTGDVIAQILTQVKQLGQGAGVLTPAQAQQLADVAAGVARIEAADKQA